MKRVFCILLAAAVLLAVIPAYAAGQLIVGVNEDFGENSVYVDGMKSIIYEGIGDLKYLYDVQPGTEFFLPLIGSDFYWEDRGQAITLELAERQGISVECETLSGEGIPVIAGASIAELGDMVGISIRFADTLLSAEAVPFELQGSLSIPGTSEEFTLKGTLRNHRVIVTERNGPLRLGAGRMGMAYESHDSIDFDLGGGVLLRAPVVAYDELIAVAEERSVPSGVTREYPLVEKLYTLETINLNGTVLFDLEGVWYVYSGNMTYLGTSEGPVAQQPRYYLSRTKI